MNAQNFCTNYDNQKRRNHFPNRSLFPFYIVAHPIWSRNGMIALQLQQMMASSRKCYIYVMNEKLNFPWAGHTVFTVMNKRTSQNLPPSWKFKHSLSWFKLWFPTKRDSATFQDKGTEVREVPSLSWDKGTTGQAQNLVKGQAWILTAYTVQSCPAGQKEKKSTQIKDFATIFFWKFLTLFAS